MPTPREIQIEEIATALSLQMADILDGQNVTAVTLAAAKVIAGVLIIHIADPDMRERTLNGVFKYARLALLEQAIQEAGGQQ
jgi:hypothetical protein